MRKLLLTGALFAMSFGANLQAQAPLKTATTNTAVIVDTLHYYLNKYYFKTDVDSLKYYPKFRTDATALSSFTGVTYCGSIFEVPAGETVTVTGLEAFAEKYVTTANLNVPIRLYLFNLSSTTGLPVMPPIDSVNTTVGNSSVNNPINVGGNFSGTVTLAARTRTASFAVAMRNMSGAAGDYAYLLRTHGVTQNDPIGAWRYSDSKGFVRFQGQFVSTTNFNAIAGFGPNTDYEFMVAPRVTYTVQASQIIPAFAAVSGDTLDKADTTCTRTPMTFTNTSSAFFEHRMYNLNQFYRKWNLYYAFPDRSAFAADSSITWNFDFLDNFYFNFNARVFLPYVNNHTINTSTGALAYPPNATTKECFIANQFRARLKPMGAQGRVPQHVFNEDFIICLKYCNGDTLGVTQVNNYDNVKVYPNPSVNGKTLISGLKGKNKIVVFNMLGEAILTETTQTANMEINLAKQPKGTYVIRITNSENQNKVVKILNDN